MSSETNDSMTEDNDALAFINDLTPDERKALKQLAEKRASESVTRRDFGKAGLLAALGLGSAAGAGASSAIGTAEAASGGGTLGNVGAISGPIAGSDTIENLVGDNLSVDSNGNLNGTGGGIFEDTDGDGIYEQTTGSGISTGEATIGGVQSDLHFSEDANSPFTASSAPSITGTISDTGATQYRMVIAGMYNDNSATGDWTMQWSGATSAYNFVDNSDAQTSSASSATLLPTADSVYAIRGIVDVFTGQGTVGGQTTARFALSQNQADPGMIAYAKLDVNDFTSFTIDHSGSDALNAEIEVYRRRI